MKKYKENMDNRDIVFEQRKQEQIRISQNAGNTSTSDVSDLADSISKIDPWTERNEIVN
jgi:hypothetical protein